MTSEEIESKLPVWHALSGLFLDTELQLEDYRRIAARLRESGLPADSLRRILEDEVTPVFAGNLMTVAGEWATWSEAEVRDIMARSPRGRGPMRWLRKRMFRAYVAGEWEKLSPYLAA